MSRIHDEVSFIGKITKKPSNVSVHDYTIIENFRVSIYPPKDPKIMEDLWKSPLRSCLKFNMDGSFVPPKASRGKLFRNYLGDFVFGFVGLVAGFSLVYTELWHFIMCVIFLINSCGTRFGLK